MLIDIWPGDLKDQFERMNMMVDEDNGRATGMVKGRIKKFGSFQPMNFGRIWVVLFWLLPSFLGVEAMLEGGV